MKRRNLRKKAVRPFGKKAFIASAFVDFLWAPIVFVLIAVVFYFLNSWAVEARLQQLEDAKDIADGNYLAQVYLRTPLSLGDQKLNMAELIALYDYNQTLQRDSDSRNKKSDLTDYYYVIADRLRLVLGKDNPMRQALVKITDDFVERNFDEDKCFVFSIKGRSIHYNYRSSSCIGADTFDVYYLFSAMRNMPNETYATYIAPVDPRDPPIVLFSIFDMEQVLKLYSDDPYFSMTDAQKAAMYMLCSDPLDRLIYSKCSSRIDAADAEKELRAQEAAS